ncbi:DUF418 domain-containing protein [Streptomyces chryseus]|uniref:DUF418 domain-containing protein n=1 Tax=Streptomyces chryseus TaxID=68186 RepID=A0ABQ3DV72_9ACTN|nr:DUF418 domain-containing protein [Streptomyces chryseus]GHB17466.1 hypothetical protein GCM10010346_46710 [Streptomyces chryseus]
MTTLRETAVRGAGAGEAAPAGDPAAVPSQPRRRVLEVDALRGFALLGILLVNTLTMAGTQGALGGRPSAAVDGVALWLVDFLAQSKFYLLFSFLFGYSFTLQAASAERAGARLGPRTTRRLLGLFALGALHAVFLYIGDILTTYALLGLILFAARRATPEGAFRAALWVWGSAGSLLLLLGVLGTLAGPDDAATEAAAAHEAAELTAAYRGDFGDVVGANVGQLPLAVVALVTMSGFVVAAFLLGLSAGKRQWLTRVGGASLRRVLVAGLCVGLPAAAFSASGAAGPLPARWELLAAMSGVVTAPALSAAYVAGLLLWFGTPSGARAAGVLAPAGRMALTHYLTQSLVMALIFTGYGLGLYGRAGIAAPLGIALLLYAAQLALSARFLRRHRLGPVEWALRAFTHLRVRPHEVNDR